MKNTLLIISLVLLCSSVFAQKPVMTFDKTVHEFGDIQEVDGKATTVFTYTNTGKTPLVVHDVKTSCGCTTPEWTQTPVQPGATGTIKVAYNPAGRPGSFNKTITIQSNASQPTMQLRIVGNVIQKPKTMEDNFPVNYDNKLRLSDSHLAFTKIAPDEVKLAEVKVINVSEAPVSPQFINVPAHVTIASIPETIAPGAEGIIQARYDASKKNDWGFVSDIIYVSFDGVKKYNNRLTVSATISEDFSKLSEAQLASAPVITFNESVHDFGTIPTSSKVDCDFVVTNTGSDKLIIRKVKASCGCTAVNPEKTVLEKGESTNIHVSFDPRGKSGKQQKTITVISNDPKRSNSLLRISAMISVPGEGVTK
ncbi:MAG: DUF1573 domain-containing protein [Marinilabiliaceae bacterium]|nr:DUF1573 domain-containing protein [Marinilabiliaceae bacterium]